MITLDRLQRRAVYGRGKRQANARAWLLAFERVAEETDRQRRQVSSLMARAPHDGRPASVGIADGVSVNGAEVRASTRWQQTSRARLLHLWPDMATDAPENDSPTKRRVSKVSASAARAERLRAAAGTIRMAEQD